MGKELTIVLQNLDAALKHLPEYISTEVDTQRKAKAAELPAALSNNLFRVSAAFFAHVFTIVCAGTMAEWIVVGLKSICRLHSLSVRGTKAELLARVTAHFSQLYP